MKTNKHSQPPKTPKKYWMGHIGPTDDFGQPIKDTVYDGKTRMGPWAMMTPSSWRTYGVGQTGTGFAQKYEKQDDGRWLKVEG
jgi:hypothetical protein